MPKVLNYKTLRDARAFRARAQGRTWVALDRHLWRFANAVRAGKEVEFHPCRTVLAGRMRIFGPHSRPSRARSQIRWKSGNSGNAVRRLCTERQQQAESRDCSV